MSTFEEKLILESLQKNTAPILSPDTSSIYEELRSRYFSTGEAVEVDFRKIADWVKLGDQLTHQIHPYPAKLLPHIANFFVNAKVLRGSGSAVLDPFCGSGTVALEASLTGATPYVADVNPLALLVTKVKTTAFDTCELEETLDLLLSRIKRLKTAPEIPVVNSQLWYSPERKKSLELIARAVKELSNDDHRDFFRVCLSVAAKKMSYADPAISVPVKLKTKEKFSEKTNKRIQERLDWVDSASTVAEFAKVCLLNIERVEITNRFNKDRKVAIVLSNDAKNLQCSLSIPLTVTSPPYGSAQKYIRASSLSLNWLELSAPDCLTKLEDMSIGREHAPLRNRTRNSAPLPDEYEDLLIRIRKINETRYQITKSYLCEMREALLEISRVTAHGGHIALIVGNNSICNETLRNDLFAIRILCDAGLQVETSLIDHIKSRGLMTKRNKTASLISRESVVVFSK